MSKFQILKGVLAAAVANGGTLVLNYPAGYTRGDFVMGTEHGVVANQVTYSSPEKVGFAFNAGNITITNNSGTIWPANAPYFVQLEQPGDKGSQLTENNMGVQGKKFMPKVRVPETRYFDLGSPVALNASGLRVAAAVAGAGALALLATQLDVPRNITIQSAGNDAARTFTIESVDVYGNPVTEQVAGANIGTAAGKKAHYGKVTVSVDAACAGNVNIGWGNVLGLPGYLSNAAFILKEIQDGAAAAAGTTVAGDQTQPSATTGDVRGTYVPNAAPDGTKSYGLLVALFDAGYMGAVQYSDGTYAAPIGGPA